MIVILMEMESRIFSDLLLEKMLTVVLSLEIMWIWIFIISISEFVAWIIVLSSQIQIRSIWMPTEFEIAVSEKVPAEMVK